MIKKSEGRKEKLSEEKKIFLWNNKTNFKLIHVKIQLLN